VELQTKCDNDKKKILKFTQDKNIWISDFVPKENFLTTRELDRITQTKRKTIRISLLNLLHIKWMLQLVIIALKLFILYYPHRNSRSMIVQM